MPHSVQHFCDGKLDCLCFCLDTAELPQANTEPTMRLVARGRLRTRCQGTRTKVAKSMYFTSLAWFDGEPVACSLGIPVQDRAMTQQNARQGLDGMLAQG